MRVADRAVHEAPELQMDETVRVRELYRSAGDGFQSCRRNNIAWFELHAVVLDLSLAAGDPNAFSTHAASGEAKNTTAGPGAVRPFPMPATIPFGSTDSNRRLYPLIERYSCTLFCSIRYK
jgi:hypothetical protein